MNIPALSIAMKQLQVNQQVGVSVMKKAMDTAEQNSKLLTKMLGDEQVTQKATHPNLGQNIDIKR